METANITQTFYELECVHLKSEVRTSAKELSNILADDYVEFGSSGTVWKRKDYNNNHVLSPDVFEISHFHIDVLSPECVLTTYHLMNPYGKKKDASQFYLAKKRRKVAFVFPSRHRHKR
ncbi:DUF4440 domain-containing protein [Priestia megaterium]|uniref:DUF4440 domain-containing protein n=1 Tax=Priestia megaterium TaxID=1404 RepID=UPI002206131B|nr:DUF4440 domain-containing protein [Priestia megaterium]WRQ90756.1 DUF4440 domain-containing protein [Priestia megaterium]